MFPYWHQLVIVFQTFWRNVLPSLASCVTCTTSFNLWMSHGGHDTFAMVVSFINNLWEHACHSGNFWGAQHKWCSHHKPSKSVMGFFWFTWQIIAYVKDQGSNLSTLTLALINVVTCFPLQLTSPFVGSCFCLWWFQCVLDF